MTRFRGRVVPPQGVGVTIDLILGPTEGELTEEELELLDVLLNRQPIPGGAVVSGLQPVLDHVGRGGPTERVPIAVPDLPCPRLAIRGMPQQTQSLRLG